ncbi:tRNA (guanosine(37)-N1)-methyltransferase TrmD [Clostridiales bacterium COT073_COT-073]|nr:tRNA (guanosine(37)-N1)-methyltransferase TrmD [Clostridiales bacterium COT073_COT-073]
MKFHVLTLFPEQIEKGLSDSILKKAMDKGLISLNTVNIRDYAENKHFQVDDYPFGGGAGMLMQAPPIFRAYRDLQAKGVKSKRFIYMSPQGRTLNQEIVKELAAEEELVFLCGHYEGVDERVLEELVTEELSIGDYVLTGGELAVMVVIDAVSRYVDGVLSNDESTGDESFEQNLLEYPQYTRPADFEGRTVPEVLLSGHHAKIKEFQRRQAILRTARKRPDLLAKADLTPVEREMVHKYLEDLPMNAEASSGLIR